LNRSGLSQDILINFHPIGRTIDQKIRMIFPQPLNFADSIIQIVTGYVRLLSHSVTGVAMMSLVYSLSGVDERPAAADKRPTKTVIMPMEEDSQQQSAAADVASSQDQQQHQQGGARRRERRVKITVPTSPQEQDTDVDWPLSPLERSKRATPGIVKGTSGRLRAGLTLRERLAQINASLNKDYQRSGERRSKLANWPLAICLTPEGYARRVH
jgi:hypothetical protein